jgi:Carboxypeptidase regulatory-like domain/TonB dependent receptor
LNISRPWTLSVLCLILSTQSVSQDVSGRISGTVKDASGAVVSGATVTAFHLDRNVAVRAAKTSAAGGYALSLLPVGHYRVTAQSTGFKTTQSNGIELNLNQQLIVNFVLHVGSVGDQIEVDGDALQVDLSGPASTGLISGAELRDLPNNTRNFALFVREQPGVSSCLDSDQAYVGLIGPNGAFQSLVFSVNGNRPTANNWTLDGVDNLDRGGNFSLLTYPSIDALAEFQVLRSNYSPEFGRNSGGQISAITRSGTSQLHGSVFEFFRNDVLAANNFFNNRYAIARPPLRYNDFGFTIGGPLPLPGLSSSSKAKTFFFYSQEWRRSIDYSTFLSGQMPTPDELQGILPQEVCTGHDYDGVTGACLGPTTTQITSFDPTASAYIKDIYSKLPVPRDDGSIPWTGRNVYDFNEELVRIDQVFTPKVSAFVRYLNDSIPTQEPGGLFAWSNLPDVTNTQTNAPGNGLAVHATVAFSPSLLNEVGYGYSYGAVNTRPVGLATPARSPDVRPNLPYGADPERLPNLNFNSGQGIFGFGPWSVKNTNQTVFDTLTKTLAKHALRFGVNYNHYNKDEGVLSHEATYNFSPVDPAGAPTFAQAWANFLVGNVQFFNQRKNSVVINLHQNAWEFFAQDEYRVLSNLTLSYGVRWSLFRQPTDSNHNNTAFDPALYDPAIAPAIDITSGLLVPGTQTPVLNGIITAGVNSPYGEAIANQSDRDLAPRVGLAWDPFRNGRTSLRAGYGIFYDSPSMNTRRGYWNPPSYQSISITNSNMTNPGNVPFDVNLVPQALSIPSTIWNTPYSQAWSLDVQRQISPAILIGGGYFGNKGTHLPGGADINQPTAGSYLQAGVLPTGPIIPSTTQLLNYVRPFRGFGPIAYFSNEYDSNYNSLQAKLQLRFRARLSVSINYTWEHALGDAASDSAVAQNSHDIRAEYGPTDYDRRNILTASYIYQVPFRSSQGRLLGYLLGGWKLTGEVFLSSGRPLFIRGLNPPVDPAGLGFFAANNLAIPRPDEIADPNKGAPHTIQQWFNTAAFASPPTDGVRPGNAPARPLYGPGEIRWDSAILKDLSLGERSSLQFRAEATNVLNHTNYDYVDPDFSTAQFGQILSARDPRIITLGLKLTF